VVKNILKDLVPAQNVVAANARNVEKMTTTGRRTRMGHICHAGIVITKRTFECFSAFIIALHAQSANDEPLQTLDCQ
jgi:hypothetical protein